MMIAIMVISEWLDILYDVVMSAIAARQAAVLAEIDAQLAESKRVREEAAADRARQDAMLARYGC